MRLQSAIFDMDGTLLDSMRIWDTLSSDLLREIGVEPEDDRIAELLSLRQVVTELEPRDRKIIFFRYFQSRTQTETASALGMTQVQVSRREKKILSELRRRLS